MQIPSLSICQRSLNKNANTRVPYLSKTWAYNLSIPIWIFAKEPCHIYPNKSDYQTPAPIISGHHNVFGAQTQAILQKVKNANTGTRAVLSKKNPLMPGSSWRMRIKYPPNTGWFLGSVLCPNPGGAAGGWLRRCRMECWYRDCVSTRNKRRGDTVGRKVQSCNLLLKT